MESLEQVKFLINDLLVHEGYTLYSFSLNKGKNQTLEIVIDRDEPISLDDITLISNKISDLLNSHEFSENSYVLDVSSLGIEKPIDVKNLEKYKDQFINIHTTHPFKGLSYLEGTLVEVNKDTIKLFYFVKGKKTNTVLERQYIDKAHLAIKF
jgi:ribosome maturation factor RimP